MEQLMIFEGMAPAKREAAMLHMELQQAVSRAVDSLLEVGRLLKRMRDTEGWRELGFDSFGGYTEAALGIKQRQAYNYITVTERVRPEIADEQAGAGVTKLALLARLNGEQQAEVVAEVADMTTISTKELEELVKEKQELGEQLSLLQAEREAEVIELERPVLQDKVEKAVAEALERERAAAREELEQARREMQLLTEQRDEARSLAEQQEDALSLAQATAKAAQDALEKVKEKARKNADQVAKKAAEAARAEERDAAKRDMESALEEEKKKLADEMERKAAEIEAAARQAAEAELAGMRLKSSEEAVKIAVAMGDMQNRLNDALEALDVLREKDAQGAGELAGKVAKMLDRLAEAWRKEAGVGNGS